MVSKSRIFSKLSGQPLPAVTNPRAADTTAPTAPGVPVISNITADGATITVSASTDAVGVVGYAAFLNGSDTAAATSKTNVIKLSGLSPGSYSVVVVSFDSAYNYSISSPPRFFKIAENNKVKSGIQRKTPVRLATIGSSLSDYGRTKPSLDIDTSSVVATTWNTGLTALAMTADKMQINHLYPQAYPVANAGISGQTNAQIIARDLDTYSVSRRAIADVVAANPDVIFFRGGGINSILGTTSATREAIFTAVYNDHIEAINRLVMGGVVVVDTGLYGFSGVTTDIGVTREIAVSLNSAYKKYSENSGGKIIFIDTAGITHDGTGAFLPNISIDGTHLNVNGQYAMAQQELIILTRLFGESLGPRYPGYNNFANEFLLTFSSSGFGDIATNLALQANSATRQNAKIETINGKKYQTCEFVTTGAGNGKILITFDPSAAGNGFKSPLGIALGDTYGLEFDYFIEPLSGAIPVIISLRLDIRDAIGGGRVTVDLMPGSSFELGRVIAQHAVFPPIVFGDSGANLLNTTTLAFTVDTTVAATFKMGIGGQRLVKL